MISSVAAAEDADTCFELHFVEAEGAEQSAAADHAEVVAKATRQPHASP